MPTPDETHVPAAAVAPAAAGGAAGVLTAPAVADPAAVARVSARLRRAQGQLAAVSRAIERAGFALVAANLRSCLRDPAGPDDAAADRLEQLFLSLA